MTELQFVLLVSTIVIVGGINMAVVAGRGRKIIAELKKITDR